MPVMSRANMAQGFSVSQPTFNSPLQFCPALGTQELDDLINAYVPGPASLQEKRTLVSMDFFNYSHATGESFRYYSVPSMTSSAGSSPAQDSGSSFVSPALSTWSWPQSVSTSASTPSSSTQEYASRAAPSKKASPVSRASPPDFSHLPGMKIMTKDGRDVTNSASRGCKTKEQRDHAHLMRIIKACDACKKKKIRCDPSHKKRTSGATPAASQTPTQSTTRTKTTTSKKLKMASPPQPQVPSPPPHFFSADAASFDLDPAFAGFDADLLELDAMTQESWESFVQYDEPVAAIPGDYDFFFDPAGHFSPTSSMSASPASRIQAVSALGQEASFADVQESAVSSTNVPALPYMVAGAPGTDYVDFNLFSPTSSFVDDESMPVNDIGMVSATDSFRAVRDPTLYEEPLQQSTEYAVPGPRVRGGVHNVEHQQFVQMRDRQESVAHGGSSSCSMSGGAQNTGDMAVADVHGQVYYAPPVRHEPQPDLSPTSALDVRREVTQDQLVNATSRSTPLLRGSRAERASRRSQLAIATAESIGGDATDVNQSTVPGSVTSPTAAAATSRVTSPASVAVYAPRGVNDGLQGLAKSPVLSSPTTVIPCGPGTAVGASGVKDVEKCRGTQPSSQAVHSISALVALGVLASGMPASLAVCLIQFVLGLMVLGSILSPKTTKLASSEQRICGTTPLPSTDQDEKQGLLTSARHHCPGGEGWPPAHYHSCRQMDHARPIEAVGRLAALRLSCALTQWNI